MKDKALEMIYIIAVAVTDIVYCGIAWYIILVNVNFLAVNGGPGFGDNTKAYILIIVFALAYILIQPAVIVLGKKKIRKDWKFSDTVTILGIAMTCVVIGVYLTSPIGRIVTAFMKAAGIG